MLSGNRTSWKLLIGGGPHRDYPAIRDQLAFSIGFAVSRSRDLLRRILKEHRRAVIHGEFWFCS
jgi:hypothetical protein